MLRRTGLDKNDKGEFIWSVRLKEILKRIKSTSSDEGGHQVLDKLLAGTQERKLPATWFHLLELWNYGGFQTPHKSEASLQVP
jgi:hypothetical protein